MCSLPWQNHTSSLLWYGGFVWLHWLDIAGMDKCNFGTFRRFGREGEEGKEQSPPNLFSQTAEGGGGWGPSTENTFRCSSLKLQYSEGWGKAKNFAGLLCSINLSPSFNER